MRRITLIGLTGAAGLAIAAAVAVPAYSQVSAEASQWVCVSMKTATTYYVETRDAPHACESGFFLTGVGKAGPDGKTGATGPEGPQGPPGKDTAGPAGLDVISVLAMAGQGFNTVTATCPASNPYVVGGGGNVGAKYSLTISSGIQASSGQPGSWTITRTLMPGTPTPTGEGITATAFCAA